MKLKLRIQISIVNALILAGLAYKYFSGSPLRAIVITGILLLAMANLIFFVRSREKRTGL